MSDVFHRPSPLGGGFLRPKPPPTILGGGLPRPADSLITGLGVPRRKVFISYHHGDTLLTGDQYYYDQLAKNASSQFRLISDNSLDRKIDSTNVEYVMQRIRDKHITGSSCTIVLCGANTYQRKYVDWETKATLDKGHGLIGVQLPTLPVNAQGRVTLPIRLNQNINSGYALWIHWDDLTASTHAFKVFIEQAVDRSNTTFYRNKIVNAKETKKQNG